MRCACAVKTLVTSKDAAESFDIAASNAVDVLGAGGELDVDTLACFVHRCYFAPLQQCLFAFTVDLQLL